MLSLAIPDAPVYFQEAPDLTELVEEHQRTKNAAKKLYDEARQIELQIVDLLGVGNSVDLDDGRVATVVDNFDGKDTCWKPCGFQRFELKVK